MATIIIKKTLRGNVSPESLEGVHFLLSLEHEFADYTGFPGNWLMP